MNYGPEACLDTALSGLERIFNKVLDAGPDRGLTTHMRRSSGQQQFSSPPPFGASSPAPAPAAPQGNDRRRVGSDSSTERRAVVGYFVEYISVGPRPKGLGLAHHAANPEPGRKFGSYGRRVETIRSSLTLTKGARQVTYKASPARPLEVLTMLHPLEGKTINP